MNQAPFDPLEALRVLNEHQVRYVVIGGFAADLLGAGVNTNDLDICYERSPENLQRLAESLHRLDASLRVPRANGRSPFVLDGPTLAAGDSFSFFTRAGALDVCAKPWGTNGFRDLEAKAATFDLGDGLHVRVVGLDDLVRTKIASGRAKDRFHLEILAALEETLAERPETSTEG